jgi:hypothetical protein
MADESQSSRQWIVEPPPGPGEVALYMATGDGVDLNAEQEAALSALIRSLEAGDPEVMGHSPECPSNISSCNPLKCPSVTCGILICRGLTHVSGIGSSTSGSSSGPWGVMGSFTGLA